MITSRSEVLYALLLCQALLIPLLVIPVAEGGIGFVDIMLLVTPFVLVTAPPINLKQPHYFIFLFLIISLLSLLSISNEEARSESLLRWFRLVGIYTPLILISQLKFITCTKINRIIYLCWVSSLISVVIAVIIYILGIEWMKQTQMIWVDDVKHSRMGGLVGNSGVFATSLYILLGLTLCLYYKGKINTFSLIFCFGLILTSVVLSSSRMGLLTTLTVLLVYYLVSKSVNIKTLMLFFIGGGVILIFSGYLLSLFDDNLVETSMQRFNFFETSDVSSFSSGRVGYWVSLLNDLNNYWLVGVGYKNGDSISYAIDNSYLRVFVELGIIGLISYFGIFLSLLACIYNNINDKHFRALALSLLTGLFISGLTADTYTFWTTTPLVFLIIGILALLKKIE